jgi:hypothetical protein
MRRVARLCSSGLAALALVLAASLGHARTDRLVVLSVIVDGPHGKASISSIFDDVSDVAALRVGLAMVPNEELFLQREEVTNRVRECGSDRSCLISRLRAFDARLSMVVTVNLDLDPPLVSVLLADTDEMKVVAEVIEDVPGGNVSDFIRGQAKKMLDDLGYARAGRLVVDIDPPEAGGRAKIKVGDGLEPERGAPNVFSVAPGSYPVSAELEGWSSASADAEVRGGEETRVRLSLEEQKSLFESPWFWIVVGAVAVGGATTALVVSQSSTTRCLCVTIGGSDCPCDQP